MIKSRIAIEFKIINMPANGMSMSKWRRFRRRCARLKKWMLNNLLCCFSPEIEEDEDASHMTKEVKIILEQCLQEVVSGVEGGVSVHQVIDKCLDKIVPKEENDVLEQKSTNHDCVHMYIEKAKPKALEREEEKERETVVRSVMDDCLDVVVDTLESEAAEEKEIEIAGCS